jgi:hypothetical protein
MSVIDFPNASHRRRPLRRTGGGKGPSVQTFAFRRYDLIVQSDEADLVRDVCFDIGKARQN